MLSGVSYNLIFYKAQCHWKVFFEKRAHASIESVKAKEIEGNGKEKCFSLTSMYFVYQDIRVFYPWKHISDYFVFSVQGSGLKVLTLKLVFSHNI